MTVKTRLHGWNRFGEHGEYTASEFTFEARPYTVFDLPPVTVAAPAEPCLAVLCTELLDASGAVLHRNFVPVRVGPDVSPRHERIGDREIFPSRPRQI